MSTTNIAVIGAGGGLGDAFVRHLASRDNVLLHAFSRLPMQNPPAEVIWQAIDILEEESLARAAAAAAATAPLDLVILTTGILHADDLMPEKSLHDISLDKLAAVFNINTFAPALVMKHFLPHMQQQQRSVFAALSARVGSISDNHLGGWYAYRASKAALNMLLKTASIELRRQQRQTIVVGLHPGTVETQLSSPFQKNVKPEKLFSPQFSAGSLLAVIAQLSNDDSGKIFAWDGSEVPC